MAVGKRKRHSKQASIWVATQVLPRSAAHPFYTRLNQILDQRDFDIHVGANDVVTQEGLLCGTSPPSTQSVKKTIDDAKAGMGRASNADLNERCARSR